LPTLVNYSYTIIGDQFLTRTWSRDESGQRPEANQASAYKMIQKQLELIHGWMGSTSETRKKENIGDRFKAFNSHRD
jgi:hypothetical protein